MGNSIYDELVIRKYLNFLDVGSYRSILHDHRVHKLTTGRAINLFVEAQLHKRSSLEQIAEHFRSCKALQQTIGIESISDAQLSRKLMELDTELLQSLLLQLIQRLHKAHQHRKGIPGIGKLRIIDSSQLVLSPFAGHWARLTSRRNAVKIHTQVFVADANTVYPEKIIASTANVSDGKMAVELVSSNDTIYVMDRGYINYDHYRQWTENQVRFVARIQNKNTTSVILERKCAEGSNVHRDADVVVQYKDEKYQKIPVKLRLVEFEDDKGRRYRLLTNVWAEPAEKIAEIYRHRWLIELFFKWMKQHLKLANVYSTKPQSVWNQIYLALITYCLVLLVQEAISQNLSPWKVLKTFRLYATSTWDEYIEALFRPPSRKSKGRQKSAEAQRSVKPAKQTIILK